MYIRCKYTGDGFIMNVNDVHSTYDTWLTCMHTCIYVLLMNVNGFLVVAES